MRPNIFCLSCVCVKANISFVLMVFVCRQRFFDNLVFTRRQRFLLPILCLCALWRHMYLLPILCLCALCRQRFLLLFLCLCAGKDSFWLFCVCVHYPGKDSFCLSCVCVQAKAWIPRGLESMFSAMAVPLTPFLHKYTLRVIRKTLYPQEKMKLS